MITIDGSNYDIPIISVTRRADFLDKFAERTDDGILHRELIGVYFNYQIKFGITSLATYHALWDKLTEPVAFHTVVVPDVDGTFTFTAYFSNVTDEVRLMTGSTSYWKSLTANFTAQSPARTPA